MIEILVGFTLLLVAMAGLVPLFTAGFSQSSAVRYKSTAANIAREKMESIRQLDYRDIPSDYDTEGTLTNEGADYLADRFGDAETVRNVTYDITYSVSIMDEEDPAQKLKMVAVEVGWTAPPAVTPVKLTTMFHQQFNGLRISRMNLSDPEPKDDDDSPFGQLWKDSTPTMYVHIAEDDWDLAVENLNETGMAARPGVYMKYDVLDELGTSTLDEATRETKITDLGWDDSTGTVTDVFFKVQLDAADLPDGYWNFHAWAYNQYEEPGNRWTLRFRVENGGPDAPTGLTGEVQPGNESILVSWNGTPDTDRAYYVLQRKGRYHLNEGGGLGLWKTDWTTVAASLDPDAVSFLNQGSIASEIDPWGTDLRPSEYVYRIWAVDTSGLAGAICEIPLTSAIRVPPAVAVTSTSLESTTTLSSPTTTLVLYYDIKIESTVNKKWSVTITCDNPAQPSKTIDVDGTTIVSVTGLLAGHYHAVATSPGKTDVVKDFTLGPLYDPNEPVMYLN